MKASSQGTQERPFLLQSFSPLSRFFLCVPLFQSLVSPTPLIRLWTPRSGACHTAPGTKDRLQPLGTHRGFPSALTKEPPAEGMGVGRPTSLCFPTCHPAPTAQAPPAPSLLGGRVKTWKRRWFILTDNCLYYFEYTTDKEPRGIIPLENLSIREVDDPRKPNCFELYIPNNKGQLIKACKTEADGRVVEGNHMVYRISAPTQEEKDEWIKSIQAAVSVDPFYEMLAARKKRISVKKKQEQP
ncbi:cytohesin-2-like [Theropithecus gelada]|uniref:cytohesin-2-like n=1 Tax=Theropithecus gelada TaxID=9565 RepID=UPI000DC1B67D|nr:cytohesin-2-like [Theropithecus gelada]